MLVTVLRKALRLPLERCALNWVQDQLQVYLHGEQLCQMRTYVTGLHHMFREKQEEHLYFYVSRLQYGQCGHAEFNGSVKKNNPGNSFIIL